LLAGTGSRERPLEIDAPDSRRTPRAARFSCGAPDTCETPRQVARGLTRNKGKGKENG
jgi:hypothetical protein